MKSASLVGIGLILTASLLHAEDLEDSSFPGARETRVSGVFSCGTEKFVALETWESRDCLYTIGFTLQPKAGAPAVDWSLWKGGNNEAFLKKYDWSSKHAKYVAVDCVIDLSGKKNVGALQLKEPYYPGKLHGSFGVAWGPKPKRGPRFGVLNSNRNFWTDEVVMFDVDGGHLKQANIEGPLAASLKPFLLGIFPTTADRYQVCYSPRVTDSRNFFAGGSVDIPFHAEMTNLDDPTAYGQVTVQVSLQGGIPAIEVSDVDGKPVTRVVAE